MQGCQIENARIARIEHSCTFFELDLAELILAGNHAQPSPNRAQIPSQNSIRI
jgi:hypothetical protein